MIKNEMAQETAIFLTRTNAVHIVSKYFLSFLLTKLHKLLHAVGLYSGMQNHRVKAAWPEFQRGCRTTGNRYQKSKETTRKSERYFDSESYGRGEVFAVTSQNPLLEEVNHK